MRSSHVLSSLTILELYITTLKYYKLAMFVMINVCLHVFGGRPLFVDSNVTNS